MANMHCLRRLAAALSAAPDATAVNKAIRPTVGKRVTDAILELWYFALLSNPVTHAVNVGSTSMNTLWKIPQRALAAQFSKNLGPAGQGVRVGEATQLAYGMTESFSDAMRLSWKALRDNEAPDLFNTARPGQANHAVGKGHSPSAIGSEQFGFRNANRQGDPFQQMMWAWNTALDTIGTITSGPTRAIMAEDVFAQVIGKNMGIRAVAFREGSEKGLTGQHLSSFIETALRSPSPSMLKSAEEFSRELTFTTPTGSVGRSLQNLTNQAPALKFILPFIRTPINLMKEAAKSTPLALLHNDLRRKMLHGGPEGDLALAKVALGTMASVSMIGLHSSGLVTGGGPADPDMREVWLRTNQPFSVKVGDTWYSYDRADPFGMFLGATASYAEIYGQMDEMDGEELATAIAVATTQSITSKTWLRGPSEALEALLEPDRFGMQWLERNIGTLLMPAGVANVTRTTGIPGLIEGDPVWRETEGFIQAIHSRTPGYSSYLPARRNAWGQKMHIEGALGPDIISPIFKFGEKDRPIDDWMYENKVSIRKPGQSRDGVKMDPWEYERFQVLAGNELKDPSTGLGLYDTVDALARGEHPTRQQSWNGATDGPEGGKAAVLKSMVNLFRDMAWATLLQERPELYERRRERMEEQGRAMRETIMKPEAGIDPSYAPRIGGQ